MPLGTYRLTTVRRLERVPAVTIPGGLGWAEYRVDRSTFCCTGRDTVQPQIHTYLTQGRWCNAPYLTSSTASSLSMRMAAALNSAVPDLGSTASIVNRFVSTSS